MLPVAHRLSRSLLVWSRYDASVKADLYSTAFTSSRGVYLIDPISPEPAELRRLLKKEIAGVVVTNENHLRAASAFAAAFQAPVYYHPDACLPIDPSVPVRDGATIEDQFSVVELPGAPAGEIALHSPAEGGTLILGDALINMGSAGFALLPAKYCRDQPLLRRSLHRLLDFAFDRLLFAHGDPITTRARARLEALLAGDSAP